MEERDAPLYLASHRLRGEGDHEVVEGGLRRRPVPDRRALNERTASSEKRHYEPIDTAAPFRLAPLATHPLNGGGQVKWRRGSPFKNGARRAIPQPSGQRPVKLKNPPANGRSILRTFLYNPSTQPAAKPRPFFNHIKISYFTHRGRPIVYNKIKYSK